MKIQFSDSLTAMRQAKNNTTFLVFSSNNDLSTCLFSNFVKNRHRFAPLKHKGVV